MTVSVRLTPPASNNLEEIVDYLNAESPTSARNFSDRVAGIFRTLSEFPDKSRATSRKGIRSVNTVPFPYLIFFRRKHSTIEVLAIIHGARDPRSMPARPR